MKPQTLKRPGITQNSETQTLANSKPKKTSLAAQFYFFLAEARGFEPPRHCCPHDFESCAFNHSATLPPLILSYFRPQINRKRGAGQQKAPRGALFAIY